MGVGGSGRSPGLENFQGKRKLLKNPECKKSSFNRVKNFRATLFFQGMNGEKIFNTVYIHLAVICVIWASVVCNLDQRRD